MNKKFSLGIYLNNSIEPWQRTEIQKVAERAYNLGKKHERLSKVQSKPKPRTVRPKLKKNLLGKKH